MDTNLNRNPPFFRLIGSYFYDLKKKILEIFDNINEEDFEETF